jgi:hypothetical protein
MKILLNIGVLVCNFAIVSCSTVTTELKSEKVNDATSSGLIYKLPAKEFSLSTTYQITGCNVNQDNKVNLDANVKTTLSERLIGDEAYAISYHDLDAWTKITNTTFNLSEAGLLTGINTGVADQTGEIIHNSVATITGIARAVALPYTELTEFAKANQQKALQQLNIKNLQLHDNATGSITKNIESESKAMQSPCNEVNALLNDFKIAKKNLKAEQNNDKIRDEAKSLKSEAEAEIARLSALKDVYEALGKESAKNGLMTRIQEQEKRREEAKTELDQLGTSNISKLTESLANATAALTITAINDWVPRLSDKSLEVKVTDKDIPQALSEVFMDVETKLPKVILRIDTLTAMNTNIEQTVNKSRGIAYRIPVAATARVICKCKNQDETRVLIEQPTQVPQFGPVGLLDLKNGMFANNTLDVVFNTATGAPSKLSFQSKSRAEAASASTRDAANSYLQLQQDKRADIRAANKASIDQQTALLALQKTRNEVALAGTQAAAQAALLPVVTEKSIVEAQIGLLRDQQRLDAVRTGTASTLEVQLEALYNQQKLLEQQLKILQIEQQIAEQKSKANSSTGP